MVKPNGHCICISKVTKFKANNNVHRGSFAIQILYLHKQSY